MSVTPNIAIIDYQAGNLRSVQKAVEQCGVSTFFASDPADLQKADGLIFPGQGACDSSMKNIRSRGLVQPIVSYIESGKPFLGICLGLQLLLENSEEGMENCLGVIKGSVRKLPVSNKVPHMGWNKVNISSKHMIFSGLEAGNYFYFVHSYYADPLDLNIVAATTSYGIDFCSAVAWGNAAAVQFHPEKSGAVGLVIYSNFVNIVKKCHGTKLWT